MVSRHCAYIVHTAVTVRTPIQHANMTAISNRVVFQNTCGSLTKLTNSSDNFDETFKSTRGNFWGSNRKYMLF